MSLSARRAWIEIESRCRRPTNSRQSLSARRAWIEMDGLGGKCHQVPVALRKESVDRNYNATSNPANKLKSLSARRAWIEIGTVGLYNA